MTMAVPGTQLHRGADTYAALAAKGVEFINHGFQPHAEWSDDRYVSATFYHEMAAEAVEADMRAGDAAVRDVIGRAQIGRAHSELQSLMRISYAVFCLKKKKQCQ